MSISLKNLGFSYSKELDSLLIELESNYSQMFEIQEEFLIEQIDYTRYSTQFFNTASYSALILFIIISYVLTREWFFFYIETNSLAKTFKGHQVDLWLSRFFIYFYLNLVLSIVGFVLISSLGFIQFIHPGMISAIINLLILILVVILLIKGSKERTEVW